MLMADLTMANAASDGNGSFVTISFASEFCGAAIAGELLRSDAVCVRRTGRTAFVRGTIRAEGEGESGGGREVFTYSGVFTRVGGSKL